MARWLTGEDGRAAVRDAVRALDDGVEELRIAAVLRERRDLAADRANAVMDAAHARRRARGEWPDADRLLFTRISLEQASHPAVSAWRARRFRGDGPPVVDLCASVGGDSLAISAVSPLVVAIDRDRARLELLRHNAAVRAVPVVPVVADALAAPVRPGMLVHADPGRRRDGRRARRLADYDPPVGALQATIAAARGAGIVLSPAVALDDPDLPEGEIEFVQVGTDLVEAVAWTGTLRAAGVHRSATLLPGGHHLEAVGERSVLPVGPIGDHLVEVAPAAVRARLHDRLGAELGARRVAERRALLSVDGAPPASPWWRAWAVEAVLPARPKRVRAWLRDADELPLEIAVHGLDADPTAWWRQLGRPPRGVGGRRLHLVRTDEGGRAVLTRPA